MISRRLHQLYASLMGYFWLPCPVCGRCFGGHEWQVGCSIPMKDGVYISRCVCSAECLRRHYETVVADLQHQMKSLKGRMKQLAKPKGTNN